MHCQGVMAPLQFLHPSELEALAQARQRMCVALGRGGGSGGGESPLPQLLNTLCRGASGGAEAWRWVQDEDWVQRLQGMETLCRQQAEARRQQQQQQHPLNGVAGPARRWDAGIVMTNAALQPASSDVAAGAFGLPVGIEAAADALVCFDSSFHSCAHVTLHRHRTDATCGPLPPAAPPPSYASVLAQRQWWWQQEGLSPSQVRMASSRGEQVGGLWMSRHRACSHLCHLPCNCL